MLKFLASLTAVVAVACAMLGMPAYADSPTKGRTATADACAEDAACWEWSSMGNRKRGVVTVRGNRAVVGPCTFQRWHASGRIDYRRGLERMRGDRRAILSGCGGTPV